MSKLFLAYATMRVRLFLREILQLHQRFFVGFVYVFGLILSGNEQLALRQGMAHLLSMSPGTQADLLYLGCILLYAWIAAAVVRRSARGGRVHYLAESLPLPFSWERAIRAIVLTMINLTILILLAMGFQQLVKDNQHWQSGLVLFPAYYAWILGLQLNLLEQNWRIFPFWLFGPFLLVLGKGANAVWPLLLATAVFGWWTFRHKEPRPHVHPELPLGTWSARLRSAVTRRLPPQLLMQIAYVMAKPALLIYCILIALLLNGIVFMVLKQAVPLTQKIHVYTCITGFLGFLLSSFFRNFYQERMGWQSWLNSLPRFPSWWIRQDTLFVVAFFLLLTVPFSFGLVVRQFLPLPVPIFVLTVHALSFFVLRRMQRSTRLEIGLLLILGLCVWLVLVGYLCDHALRGFAT